MAFTFAALVAWDPNGRQAVRNASFQIYAVTDTTFTTPLAITDHFGNPIPGNILNSGTQGVFPEFMQASNATVVIADSSKVYAWTLTCIPSDASTAAFISQSGSATQAALNATYAPASVSTSKADKTTTVSAGTGLTGGGDLSANRTLTVAYGTAAGTAAQGNDSRITGAAQIANNLSDLASASTARTNLGLGDSATHAATDFSPTNGGSPTNLRALSLDTPTFDGSFTFSKISSNQDGLIAVKNLTVTGGFGGQVGQGGAISYFKAVGIAAHHSGIGNYDHFWGSLYHDGTREAGMFIADITSRRGGNAYGGHFRITSQTTAPAYHVGLAIENIPSVAKSTQTTQVLATTVPAATPTTSVVLTAAVQLTDGTNLSFTADDATTVVAYVNGSMGSASTTVPVTSFTTSSQISSGSNVAVGVNSTYLGLDIQNNGSQSMSSGISISHHGTATTPYVFGINFDISAASAGGTAINLGGAWGNAMNCNGANINNIGSTVGVGSSPNRDVRLVDNLLLDNSRYIKFKDSGGTAQKAISATSSNNMRFKLIAASTQFEFYDSAETTLLARVTSSGRGDFSLAGVTSKYTSGATQPAYLTNGQMEVWHDTGSGNDYIVVNVNGVSKKTLLS